MTTSTYATLKESTAIAFTQQTGLDLTTYGATFEAQFPNAISYAETRIYTEFPWLNERGTSLLYATTSGSRKIDATGSTLILVEQLNLITPAGQNDPALGTRIPYAMASLDFINAVWPVEATTVTPSLTYQGGRYWAMLDAQTIVYAPTADAAYRAEIVGLFQPVSLSASNTTTYLSQFYPQLLQAGMCVFLSGALTRNFGAQADESGQAMAWESQFKMLLGAARDEERRRRGLAPDFSQPRSPEVGVKQ